MSASGSPGRVPTRGSMRCSPPSIVNQHRCCQSAKARAQGCPAPMASTIGTPCTNAATKSSRSLLVIPTASKAVSRNAASIKRPTTTSGNAE